LEINVHAENKSVTNNNITDRWLVKSNSIYLRYVRTSPPLLQ